MSNEIKDATGNLIGMVNDNGDIFDRWGYLVGRRESDGSFYDKYGTYKGLIDNNGCIIDKNWKYNGCTSGDSVYGADGSYLGSGDGGDAGASSMLNGLL